MLSIGIKNLKEKPLEFNIAVGIAEIPITLFGGLDYKTTGNILYCFIYGFRKWEIISAGFYWTWAY